MKRFFSFLAICVFFGFTSSDLTQEIKEAGLKIDLPNDQWFLANKVEKKDLVVYIFKRKPIEDGEGHQIIPNLAVLVEDAGDAKDFVEYSVTKRIQISFEVDSVFTPQNGLIGFQNSIGYKFRYVEQDIEHTVLIVHAFHEKKGIQIMCDATTDVFDKSGPEFIEALRSFRK
jgi:hypothetical protein